MAQLSTALSELMLFLFSCYMIQKVYNLNLLIAFALACTGMASLFGILKYGLSSSRSDVYRWHSFFSKIAFVFVPAFYASLYVAQVHATGALAFFIAPMLITFLSEMSKENQDCFMTLLSGAAVASIGYVSFTQQIFFGLVGICLMILSSVLAQADGNIFGMKRIDLFHITLIPSLYFLTKGMLSV